MTSYLSSAFLQQCFAMHRYDLAVKRLTPTGVVVSCRQCKLRHVARLGPWADSGAAPGAGVGLISCVTAHPDSVCAQGVDVQREYVELGCKHCRTATPFRIIECVTRPFGGGAGP